MTVAELQDLLARLPGDMQVHVSVWPRRPEDRVGAFHVTLADKRPRQRAEKVTWRGEQTVLIPGDGSYTLPPSLVLRGDGPLWFRDAPEWELRGRWPRARTLDELLRAESVA